MRRFKSFPAILALCLGLNLAALTLVQFTGCTGPSAQQKLYTTIYASEVATTAALEGYFTLVVKGTVRTNGVPDVSRAYNAFQQTARIAVVSLGSTNAPAPPDLVRASQAVLDAISKAKVKP